MLIYTLLVIEILLLNIMRTSGNISRSAMCRIVAVSMILVTGLRGIYVGADTPGYYDAFHTLTNTSLSEIWRWGKRDFGYYIFAWLINRLTGNFTTLTLTVAIIFYWPISILIERYSDDCGLSYLLLMAFNFFQFSMTGIRQTLALGFSIMFCLELLKERPMRLRTIYLLAMAIIMHRSAVLMVAYYFLIRVKNNRLPINTVVFCVPIVFVTRNLIISRALGLFTMIGFDLGTFTGSDGGLTTFLVYLLLFIGGAFFSHHGKGLDEKKQFTFLLTTFGLATILQTFVMVNSIFFRVVWYFSIFMILYVPKIVKTVGETNRIQSILSIAVYACVLYMYFGLTIGSANVLPYSFA